MKKSLIALAALGAFAGAASAQSSVTLYGTLDVGVSKQTGLALTAFGVNGNSFHTPSRWGIRGTEDLGNGLSAIFDLQTSGIGLGNGSMGQTKVCTNTTATATAPCAQASVQSSSYFGREAYVGLKGGFGTVKAGLDASVATYGFFPLTLNDISTSDAASSVGIEPVTWYGSSRRPAFVSYTSPNMGGLDVMVGYTLKGTMEDVLAIHDKASTQARANYAAGPLTLGLAVETARSAATKTAYGLGAKYDVGMADLTLRYVKSPNGTDKGLSGGVVGKFGAAKAGLQIAKNSDTKDMGIELFANYALSKRTTLYADFLQLNKDVGSDSKKLGLGVQHNF